MAGIALHAVQTARVNRNHGSLHIYQIVFAQSGVLLTEEKMSGLAEPAKGSALEIQKSPWLVASVFRARFAQQQGCHSPQSLASSVFSAVKSR